MPTRTFVRMQTRGYKRDQDESLDHLIDQTRLYEMEAATASTSTLRLVTGSTMSYWIPTGTSARTAVYFCSNRSTKSSVWRERRPERWLILATPI